jgi:membrane peptidoglycan carboxypeptidase
MKNAANLVHKTIEPLIEEESAGLAGRIKAPSIYDPVKHPDRFHERKIKVLAEMNFS